MCPRSWATQVARCCSSVTRPNSEIGVQVAVLPRTVNPTGSGADVPRDAALATSSPQCTQIGTPRTDGIAVLARHRARDLDDVPEVVGNPGREVLLERHAAELGVDAGELELRGGQRPPAQCAEALAAQTSKRLDEVVDRVVATHRALMRRPIERREFEARPLRNDDPRARNPVAPLPFYEMADDFARAPRLGPLILARPRVREANQQRTQH